jgi:hypothetical protein
VYLSAAFTHHDHDYVERRGGHALLSHLGTAPGRCAFRHAALQRAADAYETARNAEASEAEQAGLALLVMQRALFAAEDLGGLIHALLGDPPSLQRLTSTTVADLDAAYVAVWRDPQAIRSVFLLPDDEVIDQEDEVTGAQKAAMLRLAQLVDDRRRIGLETVGRFWLHFSDVAKATMHGFPFIAGEFVLGPPPAGRIGRDIRPSRQRPWTLAVQSTQNHKKAEIITSRRVIELHPQQVRRFLAAGRQAARLTEDLSGAQFTSIQSGYGYTVPMNLKHRLSTGEQELVDELQRRRAELGDD